MKTLDTKHERIRVSKDNPIDAQNCIDQHVKNSGYVIVVPLHNENGMFKAELENPAQLELLTE